MFRKWGIFALVFFLIAVPVSASFGGIANAAVSSRIAVIKVLSGDVNVQKAGGAKTFKAFAKLSLNQGDKLMTGSDGTAELQFANGTSEDDLFSVGNNATLAFSKLSDKKGTVTRVSMLKGTAWVDVKSIKSKEDDFRLETPTAIMGVRGTAFYAAVNPASGSTTTAVLSGVVQFAKTGNAAFGGTPLNLYPTQEITAQQDGMPVSSEQVRLVNIGELVQGMQPEVVASLLRSKQKIDSENREMLARYERDKLPSSLGATADDLARFRRNTSDLVGVFAKQAVAQNKLDLDRLKQIEIELQAAFNLDKAELQLTEADKLKQEAAKQRESEAVQKQTDDHAARLKALQDMLPDQLRAIEAAKQAQLDANQKAAAEARAKAEAELLSQLNEAQKAQFQADKTANATPTSTPAPATTMPSSSESRLAALELSGATLSPAFSRDRLAYTASVGSGTARVEVRPVQLEAGATLAVNGEALADGKKMVALEYGANSIDIQIVPPDRSLIRHYIVSITRELLGVADIGIGASSLQLDFASGNPATPIDVPADVQALDLKLNAPEAPEIKVNGTDVPAMPSIAGSQTTDAADTAWHFSIPLQTGTNAINIKAKAGGKTKTYTLYAHRLSLNTGLSSLMIKSADGQRKFWASPVQNEIGKFKVIVPAAMTEGLLDFWPGDSRSTLELNGNAYRFGQSAPVSLTSDVSQLTLSIRSESGTTATYELVLDRIPLGSGGSAALGGVRLMENGSTGALLTPDPNLRMFSDAPVTQTGVTFTISFPDNDPYWRYLSVHRMDTDEDVYPNPSNGWYTIPLSATGDTTIEFRLRSADQTASNTYVWIIKKVIMAEPSGWEVVAGQPLAGQLAGSDPAGLPLTYALVPGSGPAFGSLSLNADGSFDYQAASGAVGAVRFDYTVSNGADVSQPATVTIFVKRPEPALTGLTQWRLSANGTQANPYYMGQSTDPQEDGAFVYARYIDTLPAPLDLTFQLDSSVTEASLSYDDSQNAHRTVDMMNASGSIVLTNLKYGLNKVLIDYLRDNGDGTTTRYKLLLKLYMNTLSLYVPQAHANGATVPMFSAGIKAYTAIVPAGTGEIRLQAEAADPYSSYQILSNGTPVSIDGSEYPIGLSDGWNRIAIRLSRLGLGLDVDEYTIDIYQGDEEPSGYSLSVSGTAVPDGSAVGFTQDADLFTHWHGQAPSGSTAVMLEPAADMANTYIGGVYLVKNGAWEWVNPTQPGSGIFPIPLESGNARLYVLLNMYGRPPLVYEIEVSN
ncbi:cadherin-like beta sandwich domain-containing protein [Cohnella sp. JJ-181]|uniref:cadherin-like beta sandwich domain-containing protein n=1 Tax=Cohnella rhizoplanae TaxID=2974897 RepID=UPI0022FFAAEA|nr:cadherin-like beta sandwich domain-containing protein [Cohnella sp. JJ-181]CAI6033699.1 hypothetical protein COHCIP112018_00808 [Cohnella sp. JJ-181]